MKGMSPSRRRFIETRRRVDLLMAARPQDLGLRLEDLLHPVVHPVVQEAIDLRLQRLRVPPSRLRHFRELAVPPTVWATKHEGNLDVCALFGVEVAFARRAMTSMAEVSAPIAMVTNGVARGGNAPASVPGFGYEDRASLDALVAPTVHAITSNPTVMGRWVPTGHQHHLYGCDPLCPPAEALALVGAWFTQRERWTASRADDGLPEPRPEVVVLGLGPYAGPVILGTMMPFHDVVVDGYPSGDHAGVSAAPVGIVVNFASANTLRLAAALVPGHDRLEDLPGFIKLLHAVRHEVDGFSPPCDELLRRLHRQRRTDLPVFVLGGPATHGVFVHLAHELGLVPEPLYGHDTARCGIFVQNPEGRSHRGIPHLPGTVVSLWRWS